MLQYHGEKSYKSTLEKNTFLLYCPVYNFLMCLHIQLSSNSPARQVRYYYFHFIDEETET